MVRHTISHADQLFWGNAQDNGANNSKRGVPFTPLALVSLGTPVVADADGICAAQAVGAAGALTINGALASGGTVTLDVPRTVEIDSANAGDTTQTITITGTDQYGYTLVEDIDANGTTAVAGLKAFKTITSVVASASFAGNVNVGTTDALGLPYRIDKGDVIMAIFDGALDLTTSAVLGTVVPAVTTDPATATTGDVRGTYNPNGTLDGTKEVSLLIKIADVANRTGAFGVSQYGG